MPAKYGIECHAMEGGQEIKCGLCGEPMLLMDGDCVAMYQSPGVWPGVLAHDTCCRKRDEDPEGGWQELLRQ